MHGSFSELFDAQEAEKKKALELINLTQEQSAELKNVQKKLEEALQQLRQSEWNDNLSDFLFDCAAVDS